MKKLFLSAISIALAASAYAIPNTFSEGDVISAEQMNENFQALVNSNQIRETNVNCNDGATIAGAIEKGFNSITVSGTCAENLQFSMWREDSAENGTPTGKLAPRFLKISGADANAKIVDTSSNTESTLSVNGGATLFLENITVSGGEYGINAQRNSNLYLSGVTVENFYETGIRVADSAWLGVDDDGATVSGAGSGYGIRFGTGASGWVSTVAIANVDQGINLNGGSTLLLKGYSISAASRGISLDNSRVLKYGNGSASIEGTNDRAVSVSHGVFTNWEGTLEIKNLNGGQGLDFFMSQGNIKNLIIPDFNNVGSGGRPALQLSAGSSAYISGAEITGSTDGAMINIDGGSRGKIENSTISVTSAEAGLQLGGSSRLVIQRSTVTGNVTDVLIGVGKGSSVEIYDGSALTVTSTDTGLGIFGGSRLDFRDSTLSGTVDGNLINIDEGSSVHVHHSTLTETSGWQGINVIGNSWLMFRESTLNAPQKGINVVQNSYAVIRSNSAITAGDHMGVDVGLGAGVQVHSGASIVSTGNAAMFVGMAGVAEVNTSEGGAIIGADSEADIYVADKSTLRVSGDNPVGSINCWNNGTVYADEGTVTDLPTNCTE